ncbi:hypothetical protein D3C80_1136620 [compost metagenome]
MRSGRFSLTISVALRTFSTSSPCPDVPEEYESMAILGSMPNIKLLSAEEIAISDSCSAVGFGFTAQSPKTETRSGKHMKKTEETTETPGFVFTNCKAGRIVC